MVSVKVAYNMEVVKKAKLANIYGEYQRSGRAQVWPIERLAVNLLHKIYSWFLHSSKAKLTNIYGENPRSDQD